jgi:drug/metabolite transporter (DMT)-like permease
VLQFTSPIFIMLISAAFSARNTTDGFCYALLTFCGIAVSLLADWRRAPGGDLTGVLARFYGGKYVSVSRRRRAKNERHIFRAGTDGSYRYTLRLFYTGNGDDGRVISVIILGVAQIGITLHTPGAGDQSLPAVGAF